MECIIGSSVIHGAKTISKFTYPRIKTLLKYEQNICDLRKELERLTNTKMETEDAVTVAKMEGRIPYKQVNRWLAEATEVEDAVRQLLAVHDEYTDGKGSKMFRQCQQFRRVAKKLDLVKKLNDTHFEIVAPERCSPIHAVEEMAVTPLVGQRAPSDMKQLLEILNRDDIRSIAIWGMGGIGKTTLVKNLNNELCFPSPNSFDIVIWVQVSRASDLSTIQSQIAKRLHINLKAGDNIANKILQLLKLRRKILLIFDDVWEKIDLYALGIPSRDPCCKVLLTTRSRNVCRHMAIDFSFQLKLMSEEDACSLFAQSVGPVIGLHGIESLARKFIAICHGLPLTIKTAGKSMRDRPEVEVWENACLRWGWVSPLFDNIKNEVFATLETSFYFLPSDLKQCFLYCAMYPESFSIDVHELIQCWMSDGLINENQSLDDIFSCGSAWVEELKDLCLLDQDSEGTVKMYDTYHRLAILLYQSEKLHGFHRQSVHHMPKESPKRISLAHFKIRKLPKFRVYDELTVLFLQGNPIEKIQDKFFYDLKRLRILNLSETKITSLPSSFLCLHELRSLFLRDCPLENLPSFKNLSQLLVLDLSSTKVLKLPKGFRSLCRLRELNLSNTKYLKNISARNISGLLSLETLDVSFSAYNWDKKSTFDELLLLDHLSVLKIRLDSVEYLASASSWIKKLNRFAIQVSPRSCGSNHHVGKHNEKQLVLRGVNFVQEDLEDLLDTTRSLDLLTCGGMIQKHWLSLSSLISLTISNCDDIRCFIKNESSSKEMFPNLQHLVLDQLKILETTVEGILPRGRCLSNLKTMQVSDCPMLKGAISYAMLRHVQNLEEIKVSNCEIMSCIINSGEHGETLPYLRVLEMRDMVNLTAVCDGTSVFPALQHIEVFGCSKLKKIPHSISKAQRD